jgi:hypothetical protein
MSQSDIRFWVAVQNISGQPLLASAYFSPTLCTIVKTQDTSTVTCRIVGTTVYDGEYRCVIDHHETFIAGRKTTLYVATLPIPWTGNPRLGGSIIIL